MSSISVQKDGVKQRKLSTSNNIDAKTVGLRRCTRPRKASGSTVRRCCACSQSAETCSAASKTTTKKSSLLPSKSGSDSDVKTIKSSEAEISSPFGKKASAQTLDASADRGRGISITQKQERGAQKLSPTSQNTAIKKQATFFQRMIKQNPAAPAVVWREKAEGSDKIPTLETKSTENMHSTPSSSNSKLKTSAVPEKVTEVGTSQGQRLGKEKAEPTSSIGQAELSTDTDSMTSESDCSSDYSDDEHHITWDGFDEDNYRLGQSCSLCEEDLAVASWNDDYDGEFSKLPVIAVMPCGHLFHQHCLDQGDFGRQDADPFCVFCSSVVS